MLTSKIVGSSIYASSAPTMDEIDANINAKNFGIALKLCNEFLSACFKREKSNAEFPKNIRNEIAIITAKVRIIKTMAMVQEQCKNEKKPAPGLNSWM